MVEIPADTFMMGTEDEEIKRLNKKYGNDWFKNESPQHKVTIPNFYMAKYQVTQTQWKQAALLPQIEKELDSDPSYFKGDKLPVEKVSWLDAVEFCKRLSKATGKQYRLPSEAEWEYACRAGKTTPFHFGKTITTDLANYRGANYEYKGKVYPGTYTNEPKGVFRDRTTPVGSFSPNAFGRYDMHGNVYEWCADDWHENYIGAPNNGNAWRSRTSDRKVIRGGSWFDFPNLCRSAIRGISVRGYW